MLLVVAFAPWCGRLLSKIGLKGNDTAELLLKELSVHDGTPGTVAGGLEVLDRTLRTWGVPMEGVRLVDASGLSADNRLTCAAVLAVLDRAAGDAHALAAVARSKQEAAACDSARDYLELLVVLTRIAGVLDCVREVVATTIPDVETLGRVAHHELHIAPVLTGEGIDSPQLIRLDGPDGVARVRDHRRLVRR